MRVSTVETVRLDEHPHLVWVRIHTDTGLIGLGETRYAARAVEAAVHELFAPLLVGEEAHDIEKHWTAMFRLANHWGYGGAELRAISALDIALWDVVGQALDRPVHDLLGGRVRERVAVYDTGGGPDYWHDPVPYVRELLDRGITAMKVDGYPARHAGDGLDLAPHERDRILAPIRAIRDGVGNDMRIAVDGHGFWSLPAAMNLAGELEPYSIMWLEEMSAPLTVQAHRRLRQVTSIPVAGAERLTTRYQFRDFIERGALDIVMPDVGWTGGITETKKIAALAETHQLPVTLHDCTGPVNLLASAHVSVSTPNATFLETTRPYYEGWYRDVVTPDVLIEDGHLTPPSGPGLGARLRPEVLERPDAHLAVTTASAPHYLGWAG